MWHIDQVYICSPHLSTVPSFWPIPRRVQHVETAAVLPEDLAAVLQLQTPIGQWKLCKRLYRALGHTPASIPSPPEGVKDGRWATALAVTFLRRQPDLIDLTYEAYR